ncbi:crinkler family protein [Gigaspora margarita]|uniref:Crinkler family protein n=1 Tax=Gigaspora margarita TaxID=4874 RepID=A0A8H4ACQ9_GIGMA|nr:crinkler family protein [Gigaspora margarita]
MLEKYFCNGDKENKTANWLSSKCESAKGQEYMESESALTSKYDNLISNIWDTLKRGVAFKIDKNRKVKEHTAEEKAHSSNFSKARDELLGRMGNWNNLFYGQVPYLLSYAAAGESLQFFAITSKKQLTPISGRYDLLSPLGNFKLLVTIYDFLHEYGISLYKVIKWNNNTYVTIVSEEIVLKEIKCFNEYILPVCHKHLPYNEKELRDAISAILNALNLLHRRDLVHRDICWDNVLISNGIWLQSDYEHAGRNGQKPNFHIDHWPENAYNLYDRKCDLFLVGKLFDQLSFNFSLDAQELCGYLKQ